MNSLKRNEWIDGYKFMLIFLIALCHYTARYSELYSCPDFTFKFYEGGSIGNFMFMFISGYFLVKSLFCEHGITNVLKFCVNKWWRLFPAAVVSITLIYIVTSISPLTNDRMVSLKELLLNFLIIHPTIPFVDGCHWFIESLLQIQLVLSLLILFESRRKRINAILILWLFSFSVFICYDNPNTIIDNVLQRMFCVKWMPVLLAGSVFSLIKQGHINRNWIVAIIAVMVFYSYRLEYAAFLFVPFLVFLLMIKFEKKLRCPYLPSYLGKASFVWYLIHQNIGFCIINEVREMGINSEMLLVMIALLTTLGLAVFLNRTISRIPQKIFIQ